MMNMPYDVVIKKIIEDKGLTQAEIEDKINKKMEQLAGLISKDGAAHIIANELGVKLMEQKGAVKINEIFAGMRGVETQGKVTRKLELYEFQRGETTGKVASFFIGDETGQMRITLWNDQTKDFDSIKVGDIIKIKDASTKKNNNFVEIHLDARSQLLINPSGVKIEEVKQFNRERKSIKDLTEDDQNIEIVGTIVQVFDIRFFEVCSECNKRLQQGNDGLFCAQHGKDKIDYSYVLNVFLDDGTSTIRSVFFRNQLQNLMKKTHDEILGYRMLPDTFEQVKNELLGEMIKVVGRTTKNKMFDRLEFMSNLVFTDIDPEEEIKRLAKESSAE
ncbi:MAG: OB-fold nucleic acid binding domain-containing protein [Candidatus Woesearchaeota archaeon]